MGTLKNLIPKVPGPPRLGRQVGYLSAVAAVLLMAGVQASVLREPSIAPFVLFFLGVAAVSSLAGRLPGLVTVVLSAAVANYEFIAPFGAWSTSREALTATAFFTVAGSATALLCGSLREAFDKVEEREVLWRTLFQHAPSPLWEEDFSAVAARFAALRADGVSDLDQYLRDRPDEVAAPASLVRVRSASEAQEAVRRSDERFRTMFESAGAGIAQVDLRTLKLVKVNRRFAAITGHSQAELEAMSYLELTHPDERADAEAGLTRAQKGEIRDGYFTERRYVRKDGKAIDLELYGSVVRDADGRPADAMIVVVDVTSRKSWERELASAKLSAERAKDHFLAVLSHELRTPLTPVLTGISLLERDGTLSEDARHYLEVIRRNVQLESRLIDDLLDLTRITRGKVELEKQVTDLCTIIERAVEVCRPDI